MSAPTSTQLPAQGESVLTPQEQALIQAHTRIRQLEVELVAEKATSGRLRTQRDSARHEATLAKQAGTAFVAKFHDAERELEESRALVRAQALSLEQITNRARQAEQKISRLERGVEALAKRA